MEREQGRVVSPSDLESKIQAKVKGNGRASLSESPLARPNAAIYRLASRVQDYIYFPSPDPLYIVLGTLVANMMKGAPVWVVLVGAPSSGRTILLETLADVAQVHIVGAIKSPAALLSGVNKQEQSKDATGGLLREIGQRGLMVMKDFTSMLSMPREPLAEAIGALREIFDGRYDRPLGTEGGKRLKWFGQIGFLAACTTAIDRHTTLIGDLGQRWVYYRYPETDGYGETLKALSVRDPGVMMAELRVLMRVFVEELGLWWGCESAIAVCERRHVHRELMERRDLNEVEKNRLYAMAALVVAARSAISRDRYMNNEVNDAPSREGPPRIATELGQLYLGLEKIGLEEEERWRLVAKVAVDSVPQLRMMILMALRGIEAPKPFMKLSELRDVSQCGERTVKLAVDDLRIYGLVEVAGGAVKNRLGGEEGAPGGFRLTAWGKRQFDLGWGRVEAKVLS